MPGAMSLAFEIAGRLVSIAVLGYAILRGHGSPLLFLWGLWIEEVLSLAGLSARQAMLRRGKTAVKGSPAPFGLYVLFPAAHLVFVLLYSLAGVTGMFADPSAPRLELPGARAVLGLVAALGFWTAVDLVRARVSRPAPGSEAAELARIDREAKLALFLPHVTLIAGGFCLVMFKLGNWMAWGILAGKVLFEALSFALFRGGPGDEKPRHRA
jgi:hypothetical protein